MQRRWLTYKAALEIGLGIYQGQSPTAAHRRQMASQLRLTRRDRINEPTITPSRGQMDRSGIVHPVP